jgi:hypothetical protein
VKLGRKIRKVKINSSFFILFFTLMYLILKFDIKTELLTRCHESAVLKLETNFENENEHNSSDI